MEHLNYNQVANSTDEELMAIYMKCKKRELAAMIIECNRALERLTNFACQKPDLTELKEAVDNLKKASYPETNQPIGSTTGATIWTPKLTTTAKWKK